MKECKKVRTAEMAIGDIKMQGPQGKLKRIIWSVVINGDCVDTVSLWHIGVARRTLQYQIGTCLCVPFNMIPLTRPHSHANLCANEINCLVSFGAVYVNLAPIIEIKHRRFSDEVVEMIIKFERLNVRHSTKKTNQRSKSWGPIHWTNRVQNEI